MITRPRFVFFDTANDTIVERGDKYQKNLREVRIENQRLQAVKSGLEKQSRCTKPAESDLSTSHESELNALLGVEKQIDDLLSHNFEGSTIHDEEEDKLRGRVDSRVDSQAESSKSRDKRRTKSSFLDV